MLILKIEVINVEVGSYTDIGKLRPVNEDDYYVSDYVSESDAIYAIVADGMGGHSAGEVASSMAIHVACDFVEANFDAHAGADGVAELLKNAIIYANNAVFSSASTRDVFHGMGTTFTMGFVLGKKLITAHVGDSRMYRIRDGKIKKLTRDHSLVSELLEKGSITETEAKKHPQKNVITKAVGSSAEINPDIFVTDTDDGDIILLCTDGLTNELSDKKILQTVNECASLMEAAQKLVFSAIDNGGKDNITVVLLKI